MRCTESDALKESHTNLKRLFESLNDFIFVLDDTGKIIEFNPVVKNRLGYSEDELFKMAALELHPPNRREEAQKIVSEMVAGQRNICQIPLLTKDGREILVETIVTLGVWNHRTAIFGISRDITQRVQVEQERLLCEEMLSAAIDAIDEGFALYNSEDRLSMFNAKYLELYNDSAEVIVKGNRFEDILWYGVRRGQYPDAAGREEEWVAQRLAMHKYANSSQEQVLKDGRWVKTSDRKTKDGNIVSFRVDITDFKRSEKISIKALKEKETLLREIHHRVKNNMQVISSLLSLQANRSDDRNTISALEQAQSRIHSMTLVHEILYQSENVSRIDFQLYLEKLVSHLLNLFIDNRNIVVKINAPNIMPRMDQIISCGLIVAELVSNSLKYAFDAGKSGLITVESLLNGSQGNRHALCICDNGKGLPEGFEWEKARTLGLRLVRELVHGQLEGNLTLEKKRQGVCWLIEWSA